MTHIVLGSLLVASLVFVFYLFKKGKNWLPWLIVFILVAVEVFMYVTKPQVVTPVQTSKLTPSKKTQPEIKPQRYQKTPIDNPKPEPTPVANETVEQPEEEYKKPLAFKGYRNNTNNNLDYDLLEPGDIATSFNDLLGFESIKPKLEPLLKLLENYPNLLKGNIVIPHGVLLYGQSQEDMMKLALAMGKSWAQKIIVVNALDIGIDGRGRSQIRELYMDTLSFPSLVVIVKNIDHLLPSSTSSVDYLESMDRFYKWFNDLNENNQPVLIIGLTDNLYKVAPDAFKVGRFDETIKVDDPNKQERTEVITTLFKQSKINKGDLKEIVAKTEGFSRNELQQFVNQSLLDASTKNQSVTKDDINNALNFVANNKQTFEMYQKSADLSNSHFQLITPDEITTRFSDLAGLNEVKEQLNDALDGLHHPEKYTRLGASPPRGILLYGPPGTGKTMMARALAGEAKVNFINVSGAAFEDRWVGTGTTRVRNLFNMARRNAPCIIFIDEFDTLALKRTEDTGGGANNDRAQTLNQLLVEMDNLDKSRNTNIFVIGATNNISAIDKAVLRPGRMDSKIYFRLPNDAERNTIIKHLLESKHVKAKFDASKLANETRGYSPAELNNLINQAVIVAAKAGKEFITEEDIATVKDKVADEMMSIAKQGMDLDVDIYRPNQLKASFKSIAGMDDVKKELSQMITFLKDPEKAKQVGINLPKGWILHGPPGTGKTSLARAVAGESGVTFISTTGSAFVQQWVGLGAQRVRELFELARQYSPAIIFIDEIDAVATKRAGDSGGGSEYAQTTNQLLTELDNVNKDRNAGIVVIGATNRLDKLDDAVLRPGRLGKHVYVRLPNLSEREQIFKLYLAKVKLASDVDAKKLAGTTGGFSGADIENLVSEATLIAYGNNKEKTSMADFENAKDIILLGRETKANVQPNEQKNTAYHEAGHALVGILSKSNPYKFYKITIGVRDETLGVTFFEEDIEHYAQSREAFMDILAMKLGGKIAEELVFGKNNVTSGPSSDLKQATQIAQDMVTKFGMGKDDTYIAYQYLDSPPKEVINSQTESLLQEAAGRAHKILTENRNKLDALAKALLEKETLSHDEVMKIVKEN
ncbi:MAG: AAA family ATPase [Candidatus Berkiella sp.]